MRVLVIAACPLPWPRGTPIRIHRMAEALVERGHEVHVVTYPLGDDSVETNYHVHRVGSGEGALDPSPGPSVKKLLWLDPQLWHATRRLLARHEFDVIHAHHYEGLITALLARRASPGVPLVYDAHTLLATELPHYRLAVPRRTLAGLGTLLDRSLPPRADQVIAVTERMQEWFKEHAAIPPSQLSLIPNGVEHDHFDPANSNGHHKAGSNGHGPRIVFTGNLAAYQGIETLLAAFARLRERCGDARLVLVTESSVEAWRGQFEKLGISAAVEVVAAGFDDLPLHLGEADVLVNPRMDCDGIPQKLLNYMAAGRPIVSFEGSAPVLSHGRNGLVVPDADIDAFADAILHVLRTPELATRLGAAARQDVEQRFSWERVARQVESVYLNALAEVRH